MPPSCQSVHTLADLYPLRVKGGGGSEGGGVASVIHHIAAAVGECSAVLRVAAVKQAAVTNSSGDDVLSVDLLCDRTIQQHLSQCSAVGAFTSEETPELITLASTPSNGNGVFTVAFDPLDGSSIIGSNFAVGSIFGVWPGIGVVGKKVGDQAAAIVAVYGPRTTLFVATRSLGVHQFVLQADGVSWTLAPSKSATPADPAAPIKIAPVAKIFAPGNLRAVNTLKWYRRFIFTELVQNNATLRYTGGMVPDVMQFLVKGSGIFMTPRSPGHKVKLRIAYECGPLAFMVSCAGGYSTSAGSAADSDAIIPVGAAIDATAGTSNTTAVVCDSQTGVCYRRPPSPTNTTSTPFTKPPHQQQPSFNMLDKVIEANDERGVIALGSIESVMLYEAYALGKSRRRKGVRVTRTAKASSSSLPPKRQQPSSKM